MARFAMSMDTERLDRMMTLAGVTPSQLAQDAGVGPATVSRARAGRRLTPASWLRIATALAHYPANPAIEALARTDEKSPSGERLASYGTSNPMRS